jgi:sugar transferase (PEP-CTERM system associated)
MIRLFHAYFPARTLFLGASEAFLFCVVFAAATVLRSSSDSDLVLVDEHGLAKIALVAATFLACMYYRDLYDTNVLRNRHEILTRLLQVMGLVTVLMALVYYAYPEAQLGRGVFLLGVVLVLPFLLFWRQLFFWLIRCLNLAQRTVIVGGSSLAVALADEVRQRPELGLDLLGYADVCSDSAVMSGVPYVGALDVLPEFVCRQQVSRLIIAMADRRGKLPLEQLLSLKAKGAVVQDGTELYETITGKVPIDSLRPGWLLFSSGFHVSRTLLLYKRCFSSVLSLLGLVLSLPLMMLIAVAIWLDSGGPVILRQPRVGRDGQIFTLYKFRTMRNGADADGKHKPAQQMDGRFTWVGRWLRRTRLDELPQLFNILRGDMYFVGPRPFVPDQEEDLAKQIPFYRQRWIVKPGATGWAQVNRGYCASVQDNIEKLAYDLFYIKNMSIGLDLLILFRTLKNLLLTRGAV